jgi:acyl-CoA synthetase (NDP forming)
MKERGGRLAEAGEIDRVFERAEKDGRSVLLEHEVYTLLRALGFATPRFFLIEHGERASQKKLRALGSDRVVLKIVSPRIVHKSDVGGVAVVGNEAPEVNRAVARMLAEVPARLSGCDPSGPDIRGVLVIERISFEDLGFGSELLLGVRNSREFGPVVTMGLGGLDVEYVNERLKEKTAVAIGSAHLLGSGRVQGLLEPLAFYEKLVRGFRGRPAPLSAAPLVRAFERFTQLAAHYSP